MAQLHKQAFYWANQSGSPGLGPMPRKHSLERVSPYPCALAERNQYYHCTALTLSPLLSFPLPPPPCSFSSCHLCPVLHLYHHGSSPLLSSWLYSPPLPPPPHPLMLCYFLRALQLNRLPSRGCDLRRNVISSPAIGCAPLKSVVTVSYYIVYLPEGGCRHTLTIFKSARSGGTTSPCAAS